MTNEEIYKYASKYIDKYYNRNFFKVYGIFILYIIGNVLIIAPLTGQDDWIQYIIVGVLIIPIVVISLLLRKNMQYMYKHTRDYTYNLVRQDERNRCKMEQYEYEGSK